MTFHASPLTYPAQVADSPARETFAHLTDRQREVVELVSRGYTNDEVARALAISPNTIKKHLKNLFALLDVANRTELAAWFGRCTLDPRF